MRCNWRRWLWGIIPILLLGWVAVWAERDRVQADLGERAKAALRKGGMDWAAARFDGRDAFLQGTAADDGHPKKAADLISNVWGVRAVDSNVALVPMVEKFTWRASRRGQRIRLGGYVPTKAVRRTIVGVTKANFPGFEVVDRMNMARGAPSSTDTWLAGVGFALKQLAALQRGDVVLDSLDLSVMGEAEDVASYRAVRSALSSPPKGVKLASNAVKAPTVSPFTSVAKFEGRQLMLTGHYPSEAARDQLLAAARASLSRVAVRDSLLPAEGAPQDWTGAVVAGVKALGRLEHGSIEMKDAALTVAGLAPDAATAEAVRTALRGAMPASVKLTDQIRAKEPPPPPPPPAPVVQAPPPPPPPPPAPVVQAPPPTPPPAPPEPAAKAPEPQQTARVEPPSAPPSPPPPPMAKAPEPPPTPPVPPPAAKAPEPPPVARVETPPPPPPQRAKAPEPPPPARVEAPPPPPAPVAKAPEPPAPPPAPRAETPPAPPAPPPAAKAPEQQQSARLETPAAPPARQPTPEELEAKACEESMASVAHTHPILFQFESAQLDAASRPTLDRIVEAAKSCPDMRVEVAGHASAEGTPAFNQRLSLRRARTVATYLIRAGVRRGRLATVGYGASQPKAPSDSDENKALNRRIEFTVRPN